MGEEGIRKAIGNEEGGNGREWRKGEIGDPRRRGLRRLYLSRQERQPSVILPSLPGADERMYPVRSVRRES